MGHVYNCLGDGWGMYIIVLEMGGGMYIIVL